MIIVVGSVNSRSESFADLLKLSLEHVHRSRGEDGVSNTSCRLIAKIPSACGFSNVGVMPPR